ncbi:hypothetical protein IX51_04635 [uncultured archaeon]|nr:hypothetical protein IX51_04635 [uncultured archaeon]
MAAGIGAGIGSTFLAPFGGALLSTEILYKQDFEAEALIPSPQPSHTLFQALATPFTGHSI